MRKVVRLIENKSNNIHHVKNSFFKTLFFYGFYVFEINLYVVVTKDLMEDIIHHHLVLDVVTIKTIYIIFDEKEEFSREFLIKKFLFKGF